MEDVDRPRTVAGAADAILRALETLGLTWDGEVWYQTRRDDAYRAALDGLIRLGAAYPCGCSRKEIADSTLVPGVGTVYPGTCRAGLAPGKPPRAMRVRVEGAVVFEDGLQGTVRQDLEREVGDFVVRRADGLFAYQLAVVVDDGAQGVTHVVRGADLLDSTPRQIYLQRLLGLPEPRWLHLPVAVNAAGEKLSKQTLAPSLDLAAPGRALARALRFLRQRPPAGLEEEAPVTVLEWALVHWNPAPLAGCRSLPETSGETEHSSCTVKV